MSSSVLQPIAMSRGRWRQRGPGFSDRGVQIRCLSDDQRGVVSISSTLPICKNYLLLQENTLHYLDTGAITLAFMFRKAMYFIPVIMILKVKIVLYKNYPSYSHPQMLTDDNTSDREIHASLTRGAYKNNSAFDK